MIYRYRDVERIKPDISISATFYSLISVSASAPKIQYRQGCNSYIGYGLSNITQEGVLLSIKTVNNMNGY